MSAVNHSEMCATVLTDSESADQECGNGGGRAVNQLWVYLETGPQVANTTTGVQGDRQRGWGSGEGQKRGEDRLVSLRLGVRSNDRACLADSHGASFLQAPALSIIAQVGFQG